MDGFESADGPARKDPTWRAVMSVVMLAACASDRGSHAIGDAAPPSDTDVEADTDTPPEADAEPDGEPGATDSGPIPDDYVWSCPTTSNPAPIFTADPTDLDDIKVIHPLGYGSAKPPEDVTGSHCWGNGSEWVFASLLSSAEMNVAYGTGACPASFPSSGFKTYAR